jgi:hypothetical protein
MMEVELHGVIDRRPQWTRDAKRDGEMVSKWAVGSGQLEGGGTPPHQNGLY